MDHDLEEVHTTVSVPKAKALLKSGPRAGKLRKGCRFKGKRVMCTPAAAASIGHKPSKKGKGKKGRKGGMPNIRPKTPEAQLNYNVMQALMQARRNVKNAPNCELKVHAARKIMQALTHMARLPGKRTKKNPSANTSARNARYASERDRVAAEVSASCGGGRSSGATPTMNTSHAERVVQRYRRMQSSRKARAASAAQPQSGYWAQGSEAMDGLFGGGRKRKRSR